MTEKKNPGETLTVTYEITVTDKSGHLVTNLPQSAFQVFENGVPQPIKVFRRDDAPVSLALVIDNSGSMREKRQAVEAAALALVKDSNPQDESFVINFNEEAYLDVDFTGDLLFSRSELFETTHIQEQGIFKYQVLQDDLKALQAKYEEEKRGLTGK